MSTPLPEQPATVVVGAGLCGLATALLLRAQGHTVTVLEARDRIGGRVCSQRFGNNQIEQRYDLGPTWVWQHNRRILELAHRLSIPLMQQYSSGNLVFQAATGDVRRDLTFATMGDAFRIENGMARITDALANALGVDSIVLEQRVERVTDNGASITVAGAGRRGAFEYAVDNVIFACPPRLVAEVIRFEPALPDVLTREMAAVPTWMAGHGKVVAVYESPFWRTSGLSGDAISHIGPLVEIHDATATSTGEGHGALFGFLAPAGQTDRQDARSLDDAVIAQLTALFGPAAAAPLTLITKDWSTDANTATAADGQVPGGHPDYRPIQMDVAPWSGKLFFSGSEAARQHGGFLEGALEAAEQVAGAMGANTSLGQLDL